MNGSVRRCRFSPPPPSAGKLTLRFLSPVLVLVSAACLTGLAEKSASAQGSNMMGSGSVSINRTAEHRMQYTPPSPRAGSEWWGFYAYGETSPGYTVSSYPSGDIRVALDFRMQGTTAPQSSPGSFLVSGYLCSSSSSYNPSGKVSMTSTLTATESGWYKQAESYYPKGLFYMVEEEVFLNRIFTRDNNNGVAFVLKVNGTFRKP